jgi:cytochrome c-type biogenesis protein CcsB
MAALSDQLLTVTVLAYLAAMVCHAADYAFGARGAVARVAARPARELVPALIGAVATTPAGAPGGDDHGTGATPGTGLRPGGLATRVGAAAVVALLVAVAAHAATLVTRGIAAERAPWGNMYEYVLSATFVGAVAWLVLLARRPAIRHLGLYVALVNVLLLGLAGMVLHTPAGPLVAALDSYWLLIHVAAAVTATGLLLVGFVAAALYLVRSGHDRGRESFPFTLGPRLPAAETLERLTFRVHAFAFPIWTFAVIAGAIWAEAAWGRYWGWDPKEVWAFVSWVVYAAYLHARATPSVRRTTTAWLAVAGWLTMLMNLFGVNLFFTGLHSYAGV